MASRPSFFDPSNVSQLYVPNLPKVKEEAARVTPMPSAMDKPGNRIALLLIDCQVDFCLPNPIGQLYVDNAEKDMVRIIDFILNNIGRITTIYPTLDTHLAFQIFYGYWWTDEKGSVEKLNSVDNVQHEIEVVVTEAEILHRQG